MDPSFRATPIAACIAAGYMLNGFSDWFLPSKDKLNELYLQKDVVGGFAGLLCWNSSEFSANAGIAPDFSSGIITSNGSKSNAIGVRAIRTF